MGATGATERRIVSADDLFDVARSIADGSADPNATYEGFLRGLELGLTCNTLDPVLSKAIGNRLADLLPAASRESESYKPVERVITDPLRKRRRTLAGPLTASGTDFPTEWTLDS